MTGDDVTDDARREYSFRSATDPDGPPYRYDPVSERLFRGGASVPLQPRAAAVLGCLLANHGRVVSRDELIDDVWEGMPVADSSVTEAVALVRSALGDDRQEAHYVQTVPKRGYRFIAPVERSPRRSPRTSGAGRGVISPWAWGALAAALLGGLLGLWVRGATTGPVPAPTVPVSVTTALPEPVRTMEAEAPALALSPDGTRLAYVAAAPGEATRLHIVDLEGGAAWPLERSAGRPRSPFFSPDGESLAYFQRGRLVAVSLAAGRSAMPETLATLPRARTAGGAWHAEAGIAIAPGIGHGIRLLRPGTPGGPRALTGLESGERAHLTPEFLPDGRLLFALLEQEGRPSRLHVVDAAGERRPVSGAPGGIAPRFVPPGSLVFARSSSLFSAPIDLAGSSLGEPRPVAEAVRGGRRAPAHFAVSREGTLVLLAAPGAGDGALHWVDLVGRGAGLAPIRGQPLDRHRISPDGRWLAGERDGDLWALGFADATLRQLTSSPGLETRPVWGPGPGRITFATPRADDGLEFRSLQFETPGVGEVVLAAAGEQLPEDWSRDGARLVFTRLDPTTGEDLWIMERSGRARALVATEAAERGGRFSPDGRWVAFVSDRSGSDEIWVRAVSGPGEATRLTRGGGSSPRWAPAGDAVLFRRGAGLYRMRPDLGPAPRPGPEELVFEGSYPFLAYELGPEGGRALVRRHGPRPWWREARLVQAWRRRGPTPAER